MAAKGDRPLRAASTEGRYPFLDEQVVDFCAAIAPHFKLRGLTDKWLLRQVAANMAPNQVGSRRKTMFRATMSPAFLRDNRPAWVDELLSPQSLAATGYFDPVKVNRAREIQKRKSKYSLQRLSLDIGLIGVIATQLWHHIFCGGGLADLDTWTPTQSTGRTTFLAKPHFLERAYAARTNGDSS
jgi:asparagine synthase (glutamine-hydrolysing)